MTKIVVDANCLAWDWGGIPKYVDRIVRELARDETLDIELLANASGPFSEIEGVRQRWRRIRGGAAWRNGFVLPVLARGAARRVLGAAGPHARPRAGAVGGHAARPRAAAVPGHQAVARDARLPHQHAPLRAPRRPRAGGLGHDGRRCAAAVGTARGTPARRPQRRRRRLHARRPRGRRRGGARPLRARRAASSCTSARSTRARASTSSSTPPSARGRRATAGGWRSPGAPASAARRSSRACEGAPWCALLGRVSDAELLALYRAAEALAAPAIYEGFGIPPVEAMACGTPPVIAANSGGLEEVSGTASVVVSERTAEAWRMGISEAFHRRAELAAAGAALASSYRWDDVAARTRQVLLEATLRTSSGGLPRRRMS